MEQEQAHKQEYSPFPQTDEAAFGQREEQWLVDEHLLEMVLDVANLGIWKLSFGGKAVHFSTRAKKHFGYPSEGGDVSYATLGERIIATTDGEKVVPGDGRVVRDMVRQLQEAGEYMAEYQLRWPDGSLHWIEVCGKGQYSASGKPSAIVGVTRDITSQKQEQQRQGEFMRMARHELKTPLTTIKGFAQLLKRQMTKLGLADQAETLIKMEEQVNILTSLINELRDKSSIQAPEQRPAEIKSEGDAGNTEGEGLTTRDELPLSMLESLGFSGGSSDSDDSRSDR